MIPVLLCEPFNQPVLDPCLSLILAATPLPHHPGVGGVAFPSNLPFPLSRLLAVGLQTAKLSEKKKSHHTQDWWVQVPVCPDPTKWLWALPRTLWASVSPSPAWERLDQVTSRSFYISWRLTWHASLTCRPVLPSSWILLKTHRQSSPSLHLLILNQVYHGSDMLVMCVPQNASLISSRISPFSGDQAALTLSSAAPSSGGAGWSCVGTGSQV